MDIFEQKKLLTRSVIILFILNLFSISVFLWKGMTNHHEPELFPGRESYRDVSSILKKELNLNEKQVDQINSIRLDFFEKEKSIATVIKRERDSMNMLMFNKRTDEELVKSLARNVSDNEFKMEILRFEQAKQFKSVCTPEQMEKFEHLVLEIRDYFRPDNQQKKQNR